MKVTPKVRRDSAYLVTEAQRSRTDDIAHRERRYLALMAIRVVCFGLAILLFVRGAGLVALIPAVGAIVIPYFAVIFANGGREPNRSRGFREYQPRLPVMPDRSGNGSTGTQAPPTTGGPAPDSPPGSPPDGPAGEGTGNGASPSGQTDGPPRTGQPGGAH